MGGDYFGATEDESSLEALQVSYENGVNTLWSTAEIYGSGAPSGWWEKPPGGSAGRR